MFRFQTLFFCLKSKLFVPFGFFKVWISDRKKCPKSECFCSDFRHCPKSELFGNGTKLNCLKSKLVWISDVHCNFFEAFLFVNFYFKFKAVGQQQALQQAASPSNNIISGRTLSFGIRYLFQFYVQSSLLKTIGGQNLKSNLENF